MEYSDNGDTQTLKKTLQKAWGSRSWLASALWPASLVYGSLVAVRRFLHSAGFFRSARMPVPVVVIGNVAAGGGGKTPLVIALALHLQGKGISVGVVSRGYGRKDDAADLVEVLRTTALAESGDEPALIHKATGVPVFVARDRSLAAASLLRAYPSTRLLLCDDGLQHLALQRDVEITVIDNSGLGNGWLLPAGPLRESWPRRSETAGLVLHTGTAPAFEGFTSSRRLADHALAQDGSKVALNELKGTPLAALAAIARPEAFFSMLRARGLVLEHTISLPDHHDFSGEAFSGLAGTTLLVTEKDAVKLFSLPLATKAQDVRVLAVPLEFVPEMAFMQAFDALLTPLLSQLPSSHGTQTA
ncbi:MAG: tetraacyldisaccharide 4'-kinase [Pseudomonadota bacterium]